MEEKFTWIPLYKELAKALLKFKNDRTSLVNWIYDELGQVTRSDGKSLVSYLKMKDGSKIEDIDPFSVYAIFNRNTSWENRTNLLIRFKDKFNLSSSVPTEFYGVPILDARRSFFFSWENDNNIVINELWRLFEGIVIGEDFSEAFDRVLKNGRPKYSLTMCLFWINPERFLSLDSVNRSYLSTFGFPRDYPNFNYKEYSNFLTQVQEKINVGEIHCASFADISYSAWKAATSSPRVWMYKGSSDTFTQDVIKAGSSAKGQLDFDSFASKAELVKAYQKVVDNTDVSIPNAYWQFMKDVKVGDIVVVFKTNKKDGRQFHTLYGWGRFTSDCMFKKDEEYPIQRTIHWHRPLPTKDIVDNMTRDSLFFHLVEGVEAGNIIRLLNISTKEEMIVHNNSEEKRYWLYAPGENALHWSSCQEHNMMCLGFKEMGNLSPYKGAEWTEGMNDIRSKLQEVYNKPDAKFTHDRLSIYEFLNAIKPGDVIYVKGGRSKILGRGEVLGDYYYDETLEYPNLRAVKWTHVGEWQVADIMPVKTLTEVTNYFNLRTNIENLFVYNSLMPITFNYSKDEFLKEVFMRENDFETLQSLLLRKKNLILQGAPGVGKTFVAKRLAYAIMGEIEDRRIEQIQFHQNYSYEDFMMGYKPNGNGGFDLQTGVFYNFCKRARDDKDNPYFFIIDEINRGNLSKIFGELLMLIENDYRDNPIKLSYRDEEFSVPSNLYIIGMMNTADRSLAMIDYALRRRFSFFEMKPGFETDGFKKYVDNLNNPQLNRVVEAVKNLNSIISADDSLGEGFCIGHSYFCGLKLGEDWKLSDIVEYDIISMLREYWFDNNSKFEEEAGKLRDSLK